MSSQYRRHLPHLHPPGAALFLTMRLAGSLPQLVVDEINTLDTLNQRQRFARFEEQLETGGYGPTWLGQAAVAELVMASLQHQAASGCYELMAACAMPNHLHVVLRLPDESSIPFHRILQRFKSFTALQANRCLARTGRFWQDETYDHVIREGQPDALFRAIRYTVYNPVKAGLCERWEEWPATFVTDEWRELLL